MSVQRVDIGVTQRVGNHLETDCVCVCVCVMIVLCEMKKASGEWAL